MRLVTLAAAFALAGCATPEAVDSSTANALTYEESGGLVQGSLDDGEVSVSFSAELVNPDVLEIVIETNGLMITSLVDWENGVVEHDGFAVETGADTQMMDDDREAVARLAKALDTLGEDVSVPMEKLRMFSSTWAEFPATMDLRGVSLIEADRSYWSICSSCGTYEPTSHDDWDWDWWDDASTLDGGAWVSMHASQCAKDDETKYWTGSAWNDCTEPDHSTTMEYAYGLCFGRCGAGCGTDSQFTYDCLDHDQCVRFGHDVASLWCNDEFSGTVDDWASAPNCGSTCGI